MPGLEFLVLRQLADGGFFVFGDLSVKVEGEFRLRFSLFEMRKYGTTQPRGKSEKKLTVAQERSGPYQIDRDGAFHW